MLSVDTVVLSVRVLHPDVDCRSRGWGGGCLGVGNGNGEALTSAGAEQASITFFRATVLSRQAPTTKHEVS